MFKYIFFFIVLCIKNVARKIIHTHFTHFDVVDKLISFVFGVKKNEKKKISPTADTKLKCRNLVSCNDTHQRIPAVEVVVPLVFLGYFLTQVS